jgi:hypothetical protein
MGHNDHPEWDYPDLPREAGTDTPSGFEPNDGWLESGESELRQEAMRQWFLSRYCDPAQGTPYNSEEGGYIYIHGGPYTAEDELYKRFDKLCTDDEIAEAVGAIESDGIDEWAPIHIEREDEYDPRLDLTVNAANEPLRKLKGRLTHTQRVLNLVGDADAQLLAKNLVFGGVIGALEAYLYEVAYYWMNTDDNCVQRLVSGLPAFKEEKMPVAEIFNRHSNIRKHVNGYLQNVVWHRLDKVAPIYKHGLTVQVPSFKNFDGAIVKRHDIVHRSGHDKNGIPVVVSNQEIHDLCARIEAFAEELERRISDRNEDEDLDLSTADDPPPEPR